MCVCVYEAVLTCIHVFESRVEPDGGDNFLSARRWVNPHGQISAGGGGVVLDVFPFSSAAL